jgi:surface polysaccharide O-acyltransferase-like enzyme
MITILFATAIAALKCSHDAGRSKIYFILAMVISCYTVTQSIIQTILFMLPVIIYSEETGSMHKAKKGNTKNDYNGYKPIDWVIFKLIGKPPVEPNDAYRLEYGLWYCFIISNIFMLAALIKTIINGNIFLSIAPLIALVLWYVIVRAFHWWFATSYLFFFYSLGFLL